MASEDRPQPEDNSFPPVFTAPEYGRAGRPAPEAASIYRHHTFSIPTSPDQATIRHRATDETTAFKAFEEFDNGEINWPG